MEILIISGFSGAGKSKAASYLEDMDFYVVDNMPAPMILKFAEFCTGGNGRYDKVALVYDVRTANSPTELFGVLQTLRSSGQRCQLLFLESDPDTVIKRYKETRRRHPLRDKADSLEAAVRMEQEMMKPLRDQADFLINTSHLSTAQLRGELLQIFGGVRDEREGLTVNLISFGFKYGLPLEADLVLDVRFLPNPYYIEELRKSTGLDQNVSDYVFGFRQTQKFVRKVEELLEFTLPLYVEEGKTSLVVAVGCTGGHHRSVAVCHALTEFVRSRGYEVSENHRDINRGS